MVSAAHRLPRSSPALIVGGYAAIDRACRACWRSATLDQRLRDVSFDGRRRRRPTASTVLKQRVEGPLPASTACVGGPTPARGSTRLIEQSGVQTTPSAIVLISICVGGWSSALVALLFVTQPFAAPLAARRSALSLPFALSRCTAARRG